MCRTYRNSQVCSLPRLQSDCVSQVGDSVRLGSPEFCLLQEGDVGTVVASSEPI